MTSTDLINYAQSLYSAHGDKAEAEAAQKAAAALEQGDHEDAEKWQKIRGHIHSLRGPRAK